MTGSSSQTQNTTPRSILAECLFTVGLVLFLITGFILGWMQFIEHKNHERNRIFESSVTQFKAYFYAELGHRFSGNDDLYWIALDLEVPSQLYAYCRAVEGDDVEECLSKTEQRVMEGQRDGEKQLVAALNIGAQNSEAVRFLLSQP